MLNFKNKNANKNNTHLLSKLTVDDCFTCLKFVFDDFKQQNVKIKFRKSLPIVQEGSLRSSNMSTYFMRKRN